MCAQESHSCWRDGPWLVRPWRYEDKLKINWWIHCFFFFFVSHFVRFSRVKKRNVLDCGPSSLCLCVWINYSRKDNVKLKVKCASALTDEYDSKPNPCVFSFSFSFMWKFSSSFSHQSEKRFFYRTICFCSFRMEVFRRWQPPTHAIHNL